MTHHTETYAEQVVEQPTGARLVLVGRMVSAWGRSLGVWAQLRARAARGRVLVIDTSGVTQMDASGIGVLADLIRRWREHGGTTSVVGARQDVARLLQLSKVDGAGLLSSQALRTERQALIA